MRLENDTSVFGECVVKEHSLTTPVDRSTEHLGLRLRRRPGC